MATKKKKKSINNGHFLTRIYLKNKQTGKNGKKTGKQTKKEIDREAVYNNNN